MIDREELERLHEAARLEEGDEQYYGGPPSKHLRHGSALAVYLRNTVPDILGLLTERDALKTRVERLAEAATKVAASANVADWTNPSELVVHEPYVAELCQAIADYRKFTEGS